MAPGKNLRTKNSKENLTVQAALWLGRNTENTHISASSGPFGVNKLLNFKIIFFFSLILKPLSCWWFSPLFSLYVSNSIKCWFCLHPKTLFHWDFAYYLPVYFYSNFLHLHVYPFCCFCFLFLLWASLSLLPLTVPTIHTYKTTSRTFF